MGVFDQFNYTNFHELNLEWLINSMKQLENEYDGLKKEIQDTIDFINNFEKHADEVIDERIKIQLSLYDQRLKKLEKLIADIQEEIKPDDPYDDSGIYGQLRLLREDITAIQNKLVEIRHDYIERDNKIIELLHDYKHTVGILIDAKTQHLEQYIIDHVTHIDRLDVINPFTGLLEGIQDVINALANTLANSYGLTAKQYDELQLTAHTYDKLRMTAYDYSTKGYFELYLKLTGNLARSPFTGTLQQLQDIMYDLANLHKCGFTAQEYDNEQLTAEQFDHFMLTAFEYDWFAYKVARLITAQRYDDVHITAQSYDDLQITAEQYSQGMKWLTPDEIGFHSCCSDTNLFAMQISKLTSRVNEYVEKFEELDKDVQQIQFKASTGINYVGQLDVDDSFSIVQTPELTQDSLVTINPEDKTMLVDRVIVDPYKHRVQIYWVNPATEMRMFSVAVTNKSTIVNN